MNAASDWSESELRLIEAALLRWEARCQEVMGRLAGHRACDDAASSDVEPLYQSLRHDLDEAAKHGSVSSKRALLSRAESAFFDPAVRQAAAALRPATGSHPITTQCYGALQEAQTRFAHYRRQIESLLAAR
jgi:hypothetical protein